MVPLDPVPDLEEEYARKFLKQAPKRALEKE
jgi:hypothetical protein